MSEKDKELEVEEVEELEEAEVDEVEETDAEGNDEDGSELENLKSEVELYKDRIARLQAEFENYKKRVEREKAGLIQYGVQDLAMEILPVIDNFERALEVEETEDFKGFYEGVEMIKNQLLASLEKEGVKEIEALEKPFDPNYHNAVSQIDSESHDEGIVVEVYQKGYQLKDKVIRPSMVVVSK